MLIFTVTRRDDGAQLFAIDADSAEEASALIAGAEARGELPRGYLDSERGWRAAVADAPTTARWAAGRRAVSGAKVVRLDSRHTPLAVVLMTPDVDQAPDVPALEAESDLSLTGEERVAALVELAAELCHREPTEEDGFLLAMLASPAESARLP